MGSFTRKYKKYNQNFNLVMAIKFKCPKCGFERLVPQSEFKKMNNESSKNNKLFICDICDIRMNPITVEVDY